MESRVCGGCSGGGFVTLTTTNETGERIDRLAYLQAKKDVPPMPSGGGGGSLTLSFYELWSEDVWKDLFGDEPTLAGIQDLASQGKLRLSKLIKSPSGTIRARIYDTGTLAFEPIDDERCDGYPSLHKNFLVGYAGSTVS